MNIPQKWNLLQKGQFNIISQNNSDSKPLYITFKIANMIINFHIKDACYDSLLVKEHKMQEESRLLNYLMANYDREVRPVYNASKAVVVRVGNYT